MKKIFAIALALVMVLSMASAFAAATLPGTCSFGSWDCTTYTTKCGVAKAEVVLFVKGNNCYETFTESNCAGVVKGEHLFYGVKVTFDKDVNAQWFDHNNTKLEITYKDIASAYQGTTNKGTVSRNLNGMGKGYNDVKNGGVFWVKFQNGNIQSLVSADDFDDNCVTDGWAITTKAKVCANVAYKFDGDSDNLVGANNHQIAGGWIDFGQYSVWYGSNSNATPNYRNKIWVKDNATGDQAIFAIVNGKLNYIEINNKQYNAYKDGKLYGWDGTQFVTDGTGCSFLPDMLKFLGISDLGTCMTGDGIKAHFGWDDDGAAKSCKTWNKDAVAIANAECQVAIPKTGDVSVVAYAVMALVAAAGAMGLKK